MEGPGTGVDGELVFVLWMSVVVGIEVLSRNDTLTLLKIMW
ncbi:hypothetical protein ACQCT5_00015 [Sutcliffiella halmapala]